FFQAEDGIRDKLVTGVQTCALPISIPKLPPPPRTAQNRSGCSSSAARMSEPLASRIRTDRRLSDVRPQRRLSQPKPPPSVRPAKIGRASCRERGEEAGAAGAGQEQR